jgi:hypothetical protein
MHERPFYVSIVGVLAILGGFMGLLVSGHGLITLLESDAASGSSILIGTLIIAACALYCMTGIFIMRGANWARWAFTVVAILILCGVVIAFADDLTKVIRNCLEPAVSIVFLFLPGANRYFSDPY